jgi:hypothetical protein
VPRSKIITGLKQAVRHARERNMENPLRYTTVPFAGMHVMVVDVGTKVTDERSGEEVVVDDHTAASKGAVIYCTQKIFDDLKQKYGDCAGARPE